MFSIAKLKLYWLKKKKNLREKKTLANKITVLYRKSCEDNVKTTFLEKTLRFLKSTKFLVFFFFLCH